VCSIGCIKSLFLVDWVASYFSAPVSGTIIWAQGLKWHMPESDNRDTTE
jgi:hypothetical protein